MYFAVAFTHDADGCHARQALEHGRDDVIGNVAQLGNAPVLGVNRQEHDRHLGEIQSHNDGVADVGGQVFFDQVDLLANVNAGRGQVGAPVELAVDEQHPFVSGGGYLFKVGDVLDRGLHGPGYRLLDFLGTRAFVSVNDQHVRIGDFGNEFLFHAPERDAADNGDNQHTHDDGNRPSDRKAKNIHFIWPPPSLVPAWPDRSSEQLRLRFSWRCWL